MKFSQLVKESDKTEVEVWVPYGDDGLELKIRPIGSKEFDAYVNRQFKIRRVTKSLDEEEVGKEAAANTVLIDWRGLIDDDDQEIQYSPEQALKLFKEAHRFYKDVIQISRSIAEGDSDLGNF